MIGGSPHQERDISGFFERISNNLKGVIPLHICFCILKIFIVQGFAAFMFDRSAHTIRIV